jgi:hypothetical protein
MSDITLQAIYDLCKAYQLQLHALREESDRRFSAIGTTNYEESLGYGTIISMCR